jgi:hypothetical protein
MVFIHIDQQNCVNGDCDKIEKLDSYLGNKNTKTFLLIFMEGCGPCNATRPEWSKIENVLSPKILNRKDIVIASIDNQFATKLKNLNTQPNSFPTMRFITNGGLNSENYEDSNITKKDRTIDSFMEWIHSKNMNSNMKPRNKYHNKSRNNFNKTNKTNKYGKQKGGKWSRKYKKSINCNRPKGFSQRQYCKYGRK